MGEMEQDTFIIIIFHLVKSKINTGSYLCGCLKRVKRYIQWTQVNISKIYSVLFLKIEWLSYWEFWNIKYINSMF